MRPRHERSLAGLTRRKRCAAIVDPAGIGAPRRLFPLVGPALELSACAVRRDAFGRLMTLILASATLAASQSARSAGAQGGIRRDQRAVKRVSVRGSRRSLAGRADVRVGPRIIAYNEATGDSMIDPTPLETIEKALPALTAGEKARLLQKLASQLGAGVPGIDTVPGVCGGEACISRTRIPVWLLVHARRLGASESALLHAYPTLHAEDLVNAWAYAQLHRTEIDELVHAHEAA